MPRRFKQRQMESVLHHPYLYMADQGRRKKTLVDTGEMNPIQSQERENAIGGKIFTFEQGLEKHGLTPLDIDVVIHNCVSKYRSRITVCECINPTSLSAD